MDYRKFWLVNALGNKYEFTKANGSVFLASPSGLGFRRQFSSLKVGNSELITSQQFALTDISGELLFFDGTNGSKYQNYRDFIQFAKYKPLEFHQLTPNDLKGFYSDVLFTHADKGEVGEDGILRVPVMFHKLTEWLNNEDYTITLYNTATDEGKYYDLIRDYHYAGTNLSNTEISNEGKIGRAHV